MTMAVTYRVTSYICHAEQHRHPEPNTAILNLIQDLKRYALHTNLILYTQGDSVLSDQRNDDGGNLRNDGGGELRNDEVANHPELDSGSQVLCTTLKIYAPLMTQIFNILSYNIGIYRFDQKITTNYKFL